MPPELPVRDERNGRLSVLREELRQRLRPVTQDMSGDVLTALVTDMAVLQDKYERLKGERS